jgi:outer membrane protein OmpA-like peptidoglycan-associated protein
LLDVFCLQAGTRRLWLRVTRLAPRRPADQAERRQALQELRWGVESGEPAHLDVICQVLELLDGGPTLRSSRTDLRGNALTATQVRSLEEALALGLLQVQWEDLHSLTERDRVELPELPPLPPAVGRTPNTRSFEVRFVDEVGRGISGIDAEFTADGAQTRGTNAAGIALLEGVESSSANVSILDPEALGRVLDPRWESFRRGAPPKESNTREAVFLGEPLGPFDLKAEVTNTIVIRPPRGKLFVQLFDRTGKVRHANASYTITGTQEREGTTDGDGVLLEEDVFPGDYRLSLALEYFEEGDPDRQLDIVETPLVVVDANEGEPLLRMVGAVPRSVLAQLHMFFNTNKTFLLPTALPAIRKLRRLYLENSPGKLLVVGHADTRGGAAYNDKLSLERAEATIAYLKDDVDAWFANYGDGVDAKKRWGKTEDHLMFISLPDFEKKPKGESEIEWFQRTRKLERDGKVGKETRGRLIREYMDLDGASLSDFGLEIEATAHGCGENFPLDDGREELDANPLDEKRDQGDRRVELFFFDPEFGITPPPPGKNSKPGSAEYPLWRDRVAEVVELRPDDFDGPRVVFAEIADAHFATNSAVVLPREGSTTGDDDEALTAPGVIASVLRYNEAHPGRELFIAGHTDTVGTETDNDPLSKLRAEVTLALLVGDRDAFVDKCLGQHRVSDIKQILAFVAWQFADLGFECDPGKIDDVKDDRPVRKFQQAFNEHQLELGSDVQGFDLAVDGDPGKETWGAFFDCYEAALLRALDEDVAGLERLRGKLKFADDEHQALGFGERFPVEELGVDEFRSQANRRVEIVFFASGEAPDLAQAEEDPDTAALYLPGHFERRSLRAVDLDTGEHFIEVSLVGSSHEPLADEQIVVVDAAGREFRGTSDLEGVVRITGLAPGPAQVLLV